MTARSPKEMPGSCPRRAGLPVLSRAILFWLLLVLPGIGVAAETGGGQGLLWKISGKQNSVYLLGSLHVMKPDGYPLPTPVEDAYAKSGMVVLEASPDETAGPSFQENLIRLGVYPPGKTIGQEISPVTYGRLKRRIEAHGLKMAELERLRPWLAGVTLGAMEFQRLGFSPEHGIDQHYYKRAKQDGKQTGFLETADFQIRLFSSLVDADAENLLRQMLDEMDELGPMAAEMMKAWRDGRGEELYRLVHKGFEDYPALYEKIMLQRNRDWVGGIERLLRLNTDVLVVVGAGHLVGPGSVVDLLKQRGHRVRR